MGFYWRDHFNRDSGSKWKLVRLDQLRQFTRGWRGDLRPKVEENKQNELEIKRFVTHPPTPLFLILLFLPLFTFSACLFCSVHPPSILDAVGLPGCFVIFFFFFLYMFFFLWLSSQQILTCPPLRLIFRLYYPG